MRCRHMKNWKSSSEYKAITAQNRIRLLDSTLNEAPIVGLFYSAGICIFYT
mgnify:FL=1